MKPLDEDDSDEQPLRRPIGSPYAVPLTTLTGAAYVAVTDQVQEHPEQVGYQDVGSTGPSGDGY